MKRKLKKIKRKLKKIPVLFIISILIIAIIIVLLISYNIMNNNQEYNNLIKEAIEINNKLTINNIDKDYINKISNNKMSKTKENIILEEAIEEFAIEYMQIKDSAIKEIKDQTYANLLVAPNYQADAPTFETSHIYIKNKNERLDSNKEKLNTIVSKTYNTKFIKERTKNKNTIKKYNILVKNIINKEETKLINDNIDEVENILQITDNILTYLSNNSNSWHIENNEIVFISNEVKIEYETLISKIKE